MREIINEGVLCVLRENKLNNQIEVDYVKIEKHFSKIADNLSKLCDNPNSALDQLIDFFRTTTDLNQLTAYYRYCRNLRGSYQAFHAKNLDTINEIITTKRLILANLEHKTPNYDKNMAIAFCKKELNEKYILWINAYSIEKTYRQCHEDKSILTFSHRMDGWSNPVNQLTRNFSVEIKTNFGYGNASYFYTKLKYKNIEITPFSEWIHYQFSKFAEIVRYTKSHQLQNESWFEAMEFSKDACNLSMTDETKFVQKYIVDECEAMVAGLEEILKKEQFTFKNKGSNQLTVVDKKGHVLVEYRGEKISGALDFIAKIIELENIESMKSFIDRIETCNKKIQPILIDESRTMEIKISNLNEEKDCLKPQYDEVIQENNDYNGKRVELKKSMVSDEQVNVDPVKLETEFKIKYPRYIEFIEKYKETIEAYRILTEQILNLIKVNNNIITYNSKITQHFK